MSLLVTDMGSGFVTDSPVGSGGDRQTVKVNPTIDLTPKLCYSKTLSIKLWQQSPRLQSVACAHPRCA